VARVVAEGVAARDPMAGLVRIGIDEISYKKRHRYITIAVDHDSGKLVWAAPGRDRKTLAGFFEKLGETRCAAITLVSADAAQWIADEVDANCPNAVLRADAIHIVAWAGDALDQVRRDTWNTARDSGLGAHARDLKGARYALWKNRRKPHRPEEDQAGVGGESEPPPLPGLPTQRAVTLCVNL